MRPEQHVTTFGTELQLPDAEPGTDAVDNTDWGHDGTSDQEQPRRGFDANDNVSDPCGDTREYQRQPNETKTSQ